MEKYGPFYNIEKPIIDPDKSLFGFCYRKRTDHKREMFIQLNNKKYGPFGDLRYDMVKISNDCKKFAFFTHKRKFHKWVRWETYVRVNDKNYGLSVRIVREKASSFAGDGAFFRFSYWDGISYQ